MRMSTLLQVKKGDARVDVKDFPIKLDLGCKNNTKEGFVGLDARDFGQPILWNIDNGIPLPDNSVTEVYANQFFEHLDDAQINSVVWEMHRVCVNGAKAVIQVPPDTCIQAYDIAHKSRWNEQRFRGLFDSVDDTIESIGMEGANLVAKIIINK